MKRNYEQLSEEAVALARYLGQYRHCVNVKRNLEARRRDILFEFDHPLSSVKMDGMPHGSSTGDGCATLTLRLDEIETKIKKQIEASLLILNDIMDAIALLPEASLERTILEHKYIDMFGWDKICLRENISRTPAIAYWRKGLYAILDNAEVRAKAIEFNKKLVEHSKN